MDNFIVLKGDVVVLKINLLDGLAVLKSYC